MLELGNVQVDSDGASQKLGEVLIEDNGRWSASANCPRALAVSAHSHDDARFRQQVKRNEDTPSPESLILGSVAEREAAVRREVCERGPVGSAGGLAVAPGREGENEPMSDTQPSLAHNIWNRSAIKPDRSTTNRWE